MDDGSCNTFQVTLWKVSFSFQSDSRFSSWTVVCTVFFTLPPSDQGAWFVCRLHSSFSIFSLLPFATSNYCNRMALRNKKPRFPPTPGKYLAIVLEENNKKAYQDSENSTHSASPPSQRHSSMQMRNTVHCWESHRVC